MPGVFDLLGARGRTIILKSVRNNKYVSGGQNSVITDGQISVVTAISAPSEAESMAGKGYVEAKWRDSCGSLRSTWVAKDSDEYKAFLHQITAENEKAKSEQF